MQTVLRNDFYLDISRVVLAHEFVMTNSNRCDYSCGRGIFGISLALSGEAEYRFGTGERITVREGDLILLPDTSVYTMSVRSPYRHYTVNFTVRGETSDEIPTDNGIIVHKTDSSAFRDIFRELIASDASMDFLLQLENSMSQRVLAVLHKDGVHDKSAETELLFTTNGAIAIVRKYYRGEIDLTLDEIRDYLKAKIGWMFRKYVENA